MDKVNSLKVERFNNLNFTENDIESSNVVCNGGENKHLSTMTGAVISKGQKTIDIEVVFKSGKDDLILAWKEKCHKNKRIGLFDLISDSGHRMRFQFMLC